MSGNKSIWEKLQRYLFVFIGFILAGILTETDLKKSDALRARKQYIAAS